ncbi:MAG TPA: 2-hydroxyacid dehydrogenase, partial [Polyangiaceae bacterium]|nr:2-hydroxyacid dehydrogenase [Polyangiaceae bacterium]
MDVAVFSTKPYDRRSLQPAAERQGHALTYLELRLTQQTAALANGYAGVCAFVNDDLSRPVLELLAAGGTKIVALRSAGFNNVDLRAATDLGLTIARVPAYSPHAVAEHALGLTLCLNR